MMTSFGVNPPGTTPVCGDMTDDGAHIILCGAHQSAPMVRIAKRDTLELWGATPPWQPSAADASVALAQNLFWLVDVCQRNNQLIGHIQYAALIYPGDYNAVRRFTQPLRAGKLQERVFGEVYSPCVN